MEVMMKELALIYPMVILEMKIQKVMAVIGMPTTQPIVVVTVRIITLLILRTI